MKVKTRKQTSSQERGICMVALVSKRPGSSSYHYFWGRPLLSAQISRCGCPSGWDFIQLLFFRTFFCGSSSGRESLGQARKQTEQWPVLPNRYEKTPCPCCEKKNGRSKNMSPFIDPIPPRPCGSRTWPRDGFSVKNTRFLGIFNPRADSY